MAVIHRIMPILINGKIVGNKSEPKVIIGELIYDIHATVFLFRTYD